MYIEQIYTGCLSEAAYYIESGGEAAVIDPMREPQPYIDLAAKRGVTLKYVFETHFHADFVSGHLDIARLTGARIIFGPGAQTDYEIYSAADGEEFKLGFITLKVLHTPGHTPESSCYLLLDERHNPHSVFTGDTLFVGDVGRPDLAVSSGFTTEQLAGILYDSIESKLMPLPNYVIVYPGHGAGSACGKSIGTESHSSIGIQKQTNYALKARSREQFIKLVTDGLSEPPKYFSLDAAINRKGYENYSSVMEKNFKPVSIPELISLLKNKQTVIIDTRPADVFTHGFVPGSVFIGLDGSFAGSVGSVVDAGARLVVVTDKGRENEAITRLSRIGFENVAGYLDGGFDAWKASGEKVEKLETISADDFEERFRYNSCTALDVRNPHEWVPGFVAGAKLIPLSKLESHLNEIDANKTCYVYCGAGYRSMIAVSLLKKHGFKNVVNVIGGMQKIKKTPISIRQLTTRVN